MSAIKKTAQLAMDNALSAWGTPLPDWIAVLADECDRTTQKATGARIGYSAGVVNAVLKRAYKGDYSAVEQSVRGALMAATVNCPVLGELTTDRCLQQQRQPFAAHNPQRIALWRACRTACVHSRLTAKPSPDDQSAPGARGRNKC